MAQVQKSVLIDRSAQQMFDLVDKVEDYPTFLPWCGGSTVHSRDETTTVATIDIDYHYVKQSFTTRNTKHASDSIQVSLEKGPFSRLDGIWRFTTLDESACKIDFSLNYEFSSKLLEKLVGPVFNYIANSFIEAFVQRAEKIYGKP